MNGGRTKRRRKQSLGPERRWTNGRRQGCLSKGGQNRREGLKKKEQSDLNIAELKNRWNGRRRRKYLKRSKIRRRL